MGEPRPELETAEIRASSPGSTPCSGRRSFTWRARCWSWRARGAARPASSPIASRICWPRGREPAADPGRHVHQQGGRGDARSAWTRSRRRPGGGRPPLIATFHSACVRILREHEIHRLGYPRSFVIYDEDDRLALVKEVLRELGLDERLLTPAAAVAPDLASQEPAAGPARTVEELRADRARRSVARALPRYEERLRAVGAVDFDDLLGLTVRLLRRGTRTVLDWYRELWRYVLVDEYQDTNPPSTGSCGSSRGAPEPLRGRATPTSRSTGGAARTSGTSSTSSGTSRAAGSSASSRTTARPGASSRSPPP